MKKALAVLMCLILALGCAAALAEDEKTNQGSGGTHTEHLIGGDVEVDENGMVVGSYNSKGEYFPGGQMGGMTIEEARAFDERASKYGLQ